MRAAIIVAFIALFGGIARADDREEARKEFAAGQAADTRKDWQSAIEHYLRANDLVPHPFALFNIATDYERLGKLREAANWYERYLQSAEDAGDRERVQKLLREIAARPAQVQVRSIPDGGRVTIDGREVGATPFDGKLAGGTHRITVERDGERQVRDVRIEYGEPVTADFTMRGAMGIVDLVGGPYGALVTVDGQPAGTLPAKLQLQPGPHAIVVTQEGFSPFETTVNVAANSQQTQKVQLTKALGTFDTTPKPFAQVGYLLGIGGGADLTGNGTLILGELGVRFGQYDAALRLGKADGATAVDLFVRIALTKGKLAPFLGAGYSTSVASSSTDDFSSSTSSTGYTLFGGLRYDLTRQQKGGVSFLVETGLRYYSTTSDSQNALAVPLMTSVEFVYR